MNIKNNNNIYLVGFMGSGKTAVGEILAEKLSREFIEMDEIIEQKEGKKIADIFAEEGEQHFRDLETTLLKELSEKNNLIVSCGGGLVCNSENLKILKNTGITISLFASAPEIHRRTKNQTHRPILNVENPLKKINDLLVKRAPYYDQADYKIDTENITPEKVAVKIVEVLKNG